jgi:hypothetical protein
MPVKYKKVIALSLVAGQLLMGAGCSSGERLEQAAQKAEEQNQGSMKKKTDKEMMKAWEEYYSKYNKSVEEAVKENPKEDAVSGSTAIVIKDRYDNPDELAAYVSKVLFDFYKGVLKPEQYLVFINKYGSKEMKEQFLTGDSKEDVELVNSIQKAILEQGMDYLKYEISRCEVNEDGTQAIFYRKIQISNGTFAYFQTVLKKENGVWYYDNDEPNIPVEFVPAKK